MAKKQTWDERFRAFDKKNKERVQNSSPIQLLVRAGITGVLFAIIIFVMDTLWPVRDDTDLNYYIIHGGLFGGLMFLLTMLEKYVFPKLSKEEKNVKRSAKR